MAVGAGESGLQGNGEASAEAGVGEGSSFWSSLMFWRRGSGKNDDSAPRRGGPTPFSFNAFARTIPNQTRDPVQYWMDKKEEAARTVRLSDIGTQLAEKITGGSLASAVRPGGQFDQAVNLPYIAADQRVEIGQAAQMYPAMKRKWARENMGSELATDQEIRVFIASRVREDDARKAKIAKAEARAYRLFDAGKGRGPFDVSPAGDLYRKETKVGEREEDGSFTARDPGDLRQMVKQTGGAPIFFENERVKQARANDSNYENLGQFMGNLGQVAGRGALIPKISYTYQLPTAKSEMLRERAAAALRHEERKATLLNGNAELGGQLEIKRQQIETTGLTGEQKEAALRDLEAEAAKQVVQKQGTRNELIQGAFEDLNAGYLSVQQFAELLEAGGQDNALETIISAKEDEAIQESAETKLAALKIGSTEFWSRGEGSDPRATKRYRELSRMIATPGLMVTNLRTRSSELKPDSRLTDESYREQSIRDWQDDGTYVARLATPEERFSYVEGLPEMQAMQQGITAFKVKEDALLKPYGFDPATEERIKHRALMAAARELPRDTAEWAGNADNWLSRMPVGGGFYAGAIMLPVAMLVHRLDKGEQLSQEELAMLDDTLIELERPNTWWANTLSMTVDSASIATEMYLTAGIGTAVRKGATKVTEEVFAHALRRFATEEGRKLIRKQMGTRALAGAAGVAAQTVTGTGSRVLHRAIEDLATSGVQVTQNEVGQYVAVLDATQRPGSVWEAFGKAARYQFMENTSEKLGSILTAMGGDKVVKRAMDGLTGPMRERLSKHAWLMAFKKANPGKSLEAVQRALARANVDSFPVELMEEGGAAALHWAFDGEEFTLPTMKDAASLYVSMLLTGTAMKIASLRDGRHGKGATGEQSSVLERALGEQPGTAEGVGAGQVVAQTGAGGNGMPPSPSTEQVQGSNGNNLPGEAGALDPALAGAAASNGVQMQAAGATAVAETPSVDAIGKQAESGEAQLEPAMAGQAAEVNASASQGGARAQVPGTGAGSSSGVPTETVTSGTAGSAGSGNASTSGGSAGQANSGVGTDAGANSQGSGKPRSPSVTRALDDLATERYEGLELYRAWARRNIEGDQDSLQSAEHSEDAADWPTVGNLTAEEAYYALPPSLRHEIRKEVGPPPGKGDANYETWLEKYSSAVKGARKKSQWEGQSGRGLSVAEQVVRARSSDPAGAAALVSELNKMANMSPAEVDAAYAQTNLDREAARQRDSKGPDKIRLNEQLALLDAFGGVAYGSATGTAALDSSMDADTMISTLADQSRQRLREIRNAPEAKPKYDMHLSGTPMDPDQQDVHFHAPTTRVAAHPDYQSATAGNAEAAQRLVTALVPAGRMQEIATRHQDARLVVIPARDRRGAPDHLGKGFARQVQASTGLPMAEGITMLPSRGPVDSTDVLEQMMYRPTFQGHVERGGKYVMFAGNMDPVIYSSFRNFIETNHGQVVEAQSLEGENSTQLAISRDTKHKVTAKFGAQGGVNPLMREYNFNGGVIASLSEAEGQAILKHDGEFALENKILDIAAANLMRRHGANKGSDWRPTWREAREEAGALGWDSLQQEDHARLDAARKRLQSGSKRDEGRNVAVALSQLTYKGRPLDLSGEAISGPNPKGQNMPGDRKVEYVTVDHSRGYDSEPYLIENGLRTLQEHSIKDPENIRGTIIFLSERDFCPSCQGQIQMYRELLPHATFILRAGKPKTLNP